MQLKQHAPTAAEMLMLGGLVYASAGAPEKMVELLDGLKEVLRGSIAHIFSRDVATGAVFVSDMSEPSRTGPANSHYMRHWATSDPRMKLLASRPAGEVLRCHDHFDESFVASSSFYIDYFQPHQLRWSLLARFASGPGIETIVAVLRSPGKPPFEAWTAATLQQLLPHFERATAINLKLERQAAAVQAATAMFRLLPTPCLFTDHAGRCLESNEAFGRALEPLAMRLMTGRVRFLRPDVQASWQAALFETDATALSRKFSFTDSLQKTWTAHLVPWPAPVDRGDTLDKKMILVVFEENAGQPAQPQPGSMASVARLTRAEAEVLAGLLKGLPAKAIASRRSASVNTVRSQIMAILEKTGYNSQKELMASFSNSTLPDSIFSNSLSQGESTPASR